MRLNEQERRVADPRITEEQGRQNRRMYVEKLNRRNLGQEERSRALEQMSRRVGKQKSRATGERESRTTEEREKEEQEDRGVGKSRRANEQHTRGLQIGGAGYKRSRMTEG